MLIDVLVYINVVITCVISYIAFKSMYQAKYYEKKWLDTYDEFIRWRDEYFLLKSSDAIKEDYNIYLSWSPRGISNCIYRKVDNKETE